MNPVAASKNIRAEVYFCIFMTYCRSLLLVYSLVIYSFFYPSLNISCHGERSADQIISFNQIDDELVSKLECHRWMCVCVCVQL